MLNSGNSEERRSAFARRLRSNRLRPKTKEFTSRQPTKSSGTSGVRAFRVQFVRQRFSSRLSTPRYRRAGTLGARGFSRLFKRRNCFPQPISENFFDFEFMGVVGE